MEKSNLIEEIIELARDKFYDEYEIPSFERDLDYLLEKYTVSKASDGKDTSDELPPSNCIKPAVSNCNYKDKYEKCITIIKRFDAGIIGMYDL